MTGKKQEAILEALRAKYGKPALCPMCGENDWSLCDQYISLNAGDNPLAINDQRVLVCAAVYCNNCGHISIHSLGPLGFLDEIQKESEELVAAEKAWRKKYYGRVERDRIPKRSFTEKVKKAFGLGV